MHRLEGPVSPQKRVHFDTSLSGVCGRARKLSERLFLKRSIRILV
jgi:hypothetical protein